jgi:hypothetical protein
LNVIYFVLLGNSKWFIVKKNSSQNARKIGSSKRKVSSWHFTGTWNRTKIKFLLHYRVVFIFLYNELPNIQANNIYLSSSIWPQSRLGWPLWNIRVTKGHRCVVCRNHNPFLSSLIFINKSKTTGTNSGARTDYLFGAHVFTCTPVHFLAR